MSEVTQTITVGDDSGRIGNCLQAAVASLLDLPLDVVPHFAEFKWWAEMVETFAREHGYDVEYEDGPPTFGLAYGRSPRGVDHAVVYRDGQPVWDPHPDRSGLESVSSYVHFRRAGQRDGGEQHGTRR